MSDQFTKGSCGHFCEACARRDDEIQRLRARVAELEAENSKLIEHAIQIEHRLTKEMSVRIDAAIEQTARECLDIMLRESFSINGAVRRIREKFGVTG